MSDSGLLGNSVKNYLEDTGSRNKEYEVSSNFVEFLRKATSGFGASGTYFDKGFRDGVLIGGHWLAKYPMSRLDASPKSQGSSGIPASQPRLPAWTNLNWQQALEACRLMNRSDEQALAKAYVSGGGIDAGGADMNGYHYITIDTAAHFLELDVGNHIELAHTLTAAEAGQMNTNNYDNAIHTNTITASTVRLGSSNEWLEGDVIIYERKVAKWDQVNRNIYLMHPLPTDALLIADITAATSDTVSVRKYDLAGLEEWAAIKLECAMQAKAGSPFGTDGYPKGNNFYGRDITDADEWKYYGDNDPTHTTTLPVCICKTLCGSGPDSWFHNNNRNTGVWCYNGNIYDWLNAKTYDRKIQAGYPGEGHTFPATNDYITTIEAAAALCGAKDLALPITVGATCAQFGGDYGYLSNMGDRGFVVGGDFTRVGKAGLFIMSNYIYPSSASWDIGFRASM